MAVDQAREAAVVAAREEALQARIGELETALQNVAAAQQAAATEHRETTEKGLREAIDRHTREIEKLEKEKAEREAMYQVLLMWLLCCGCLLDRLWELAVVGLSALLACFFLKKLCSPSVSCGGGTGNGQRAPREQQDAHQ